MSSATQEEIDQFVGRAHGDLPYVRGFLEKNPDLIDARSSRTSERAIDAASHVGNVETVKFLLEAGSELDICIAALLGMTDKVEEMLRADSGLAKATGAHGIPVLFFAILGRSQPTAEVLISGGSPINGGGRVSTPLHAAVASGDAELVKLLLGHGADRAAVDYEDKTAEQRASESGKEALIEAFGA